jgi:hypothetical protein
MGKQNKRQARESYEAKWKKKKSWWTTKLEKNSNLKRLNPIKV